MTRWPAALLLPLGAWTGHFALRKAQPPGFCPGVAERVVRLIEDDYAGFPDKTRGAALASYQARTDSLRIRARALSAPDSVAACHGIVIEWMRFFQDRHLELSFQSTNVSALAPQLSSEEIRRRFATSPTHALVGRDTLSNGHGAPLTGIWSTVDGAYRLAFVATSPTSHDVVVLAADSIWWMPGQIKAQLVQDARGTVRGEYWLRDHTLRRVTGRITANVLQLYAADDSTIAPIRLVRERPRLRHDITPAQLAAEQQNTLQLRRLDARTLLIGMPSFRPDVADSVAALIRRHRREISQTPNLVIDVRGNGGGLDYVYRPLLELIASGPITSPGVSFRSTPGNIAAIDAYAAEPGVTPDARVFLRTLLDSLRRHPGEFVSTRTSTDSTLRGARYPRRVAILLDRGCASSCEQFLLDAKQSRKVRLYGHRSAGVLDYSNVVPRPLSRTPFTVHVPLTRSDRLPAFPIDPHGIAPDTPIARDVARPIEWIRRTLHAP